jgi:hypothetical protein
MRTDAEVNYHRIWTETNGRLDSLFARVAENKDVMSSLDFGRWLFWSGLLELLESNSCPGPLRVDGPLLRWKCVELQRRCTERFRLNDSEPRLETLQLQSLNEKLDLMAGYLSRLAVAPVERVADGSQSNLEAAAADLRAA